jgi:hypothetical protein
MSSEVSQLPESFPVGTRYVIEGRGGRIRLRYLEFPDGRHVDLPADLATRTARSRVRSRSRRDRSRARPKKI